MKSIFGLLFISITLISCDPVVRYEYHLDNKSDSTLIVQFRGSGSPRVRKDSIRQVPPRTEILIYITGERARNPHDEKEDFLRMFDTLDIITISRSKINKDIHKRDNWMYSRNVTHFGVIKTGTNFYKLELSNSDLK